MKAPEMKGAAAQRYAGGDPKFERLGGVLNRDDTKTPADFQTLGDLATDVVERLRIARLRRQFGLDTGMATLLARVAFETTEVR